MTKPKVWTPEDVIHSASKYMNNYNVHRVEMAYRFANLAHRGQYRRSGDLYITHPTQVAAILVFLRMDPETVCAGFLHDVVDDTSVQLSAIRKKFGSNIALIVKGVTILDHIKYHPSKHQLTVNFRRLLLTICPDIRSIIVKLADRLHNMRTLRYLDQTKQKKASREAMDVYAPIADRLGIGAIKWQLQDLALKYLKPVMFHRIAHLLNSKRSQRVRYVNLAIKQVKNFTKGLHLTDPIYYGRPKHIYSIYHKIVVRHKRFSQIYDFLAMRVIVKKISDCYAVLSMIHTHWRPIPGRFKDYIAKPKPNGYQSLHTTVIGPKHEPFEIQIRTRKMHSIAEYGVAAHWAYKEGIKGRVHSSSTNSQLNSFKHMIEVQENPNNSHPIYNFKTDLFRNHVYVFTPNRDVLELPKGARPLDVAYEIHSEVGNHATGAKVNGKMVSWHHYLNNGDVVSIMTNSQASPSWDWVNLVTSRKAKQKIRRYLRHHHRTQNIATGKDLLTHIIKDHDYPESLAGTNSLSQVARQLHYKSVGSLLAAIGFGTLNPTRVVNRSIRNSKKVVDNRKTAKEMSSGELTQISKKPVDLASNNGYQGIVVEGLRSLLVRISHCCYPIPGDHVMGYITAGHGVSIHRVNCPKVINSGQRWVRAYWSNPNQTKHNYISNLKVESYNRNGLVKDIMQICNQNANVVTIYSRLVANQRVIVHLKVEVHNLKQLQALMTKIRGVRNIYLVKRDFD